MTAPPLRWRAHRQDGTALVVTALLLMLMLALGLALVTAVISETMIAAQFREARSTFYAAEAVAQRAIVELSRTASWNDVVAGRARATFSDGASFAHRDAATGKPLDVASATNQVQCGHTSACSDQDVEADTLDRPFGLNNPRWQPYAYGSLGALLGDDAFAPIKVIAWVADDPLETDGAWNVDGGPSIITAVADNPGRGIIVLLAHAYGPRGTRRAIEMSVVRSATATEPSAARVVVWRDLR